jgi:glucan phosphoethanolaminetransferase (alkaline phosphatase superfamily)
VLPALTAVVSAVFTIAVAMRYARAKRIALLAWSIGLGLFTVAALAGALAQTSGASETEYRVFYLFGGILNVAWLALGTVLLVTPRFAKPSLVVVVILSLVSAYAVFTTPVNLQIALDTGKGFPDGSLPRILAAIGSGVGSLVLIGGALWSAFVFLRRRRNGRRALSNIVIAAGVIIVAVGGTVTFTGASGILEFTNMIGVSVMFVGFLIA